MELICPKPTYVIKDAPLYETFEVTAASQNILNVLQAFDFAAEQARTLGKPALLHVLFFMSVIKNQALDLTKQIIIKKRVLSV